MNLKNINFFLDLNLLQNIRLALALMEKGYKLKILQTYRSNFEYLSQFFNVNVQYAQKATKNKLDKEILFNHEKPEITIGNIKIDLVFPNKMIDLCKRKKKKTIKYFFQGLITDERKNSLNNWLLNFNKHLLKNNNLKTKEIEIKNSKNGRNFPIKCWDQEYFDKMRSSKFVLCPNGDYTWTYRFFEAIACRAIPILEQEFEASKGFYFYTFKTPSDKIVYSEKLVNRNLDLLEKKFTLKNKRISLKKDFLSLIKNIIKNNLKSLPIIKNYILQRNLLIEKILLQEEYLSNLQNSLELTKSSNILLNDKIEILLNNNKSLVEEKEIYLNELLQLGYIKIFVFHGFNNMGDMLNYYLLDYFGCKYIRTSQEDCELVLIGSILDKYLVQKNQFTKIEPLHVWGSGFIEKKKDDNEKFDRPMIIHALRGKVSKKRAEIILNKKLNNIALGDPGLLAKFLIKKQKITKTTDVGIVPHYIDKGNKYLKNISLKKYSYKVIDITGDTIETIKQIASCKTILSSALHGLIVADSFNIPNCWITLSNNVIGDGYKFLDYYSTYNIDKPRNFDLRIKKITDSDIDDIIKNYSITESQVRKICSNLLNAFPKKFMSEKNKKAKPCPLP